MPHVPLHVSDRFRGKSKHGLYGAVIQEIDWSVGQILRALKRHGLERDSLVIFIADHGPWLSFGDHAGSAGRLREGKGTLWEGGVRVPCLMRWPVRIPVRSVCRELLTTIDLSDVRRTPVKPRMSPRATQRLWPVSQRWPSNVAMTWATA